MIMDGEASVHATTDTLDLGAVVLPNLEQDNTDRNRTSPFAFTNNKFEFRAVGSEANVSDANMVLDTAVAQALRDFADALEGTTAEGFQEAALEYCADHLREHRRILFSGDGYSEAWHAEAEARGLVNLPTTAEALPAFVAPKNLALFSEMGVLTEAEAACRYEVKLEKYNKLMNIEGDYHGARGVPHVRPDHRVRHQGRQGLESHPGCRRRGCDGVRAGDAQQAVRGHQPRSCPSLSWTSCTPRRRASPTGRPRPRSTRTRSRPPCGASAAVDAMRRRSSPPDYWPVPPTTTSSSTCSPAQKGRSESGQALL